VVAEACKKNGVSLTELRSGSRRDKLPDVRVKIVQGAGGELRSGNRRGGPESGNIDLWGLEASDQNFVQLVNSVPFPFPFRSEETQKNDLDIVREVLKVTKEVPIERAYDFSFAKKRTAS
jgi:hypothetical protein